MTSQNKFKQTELFAANVNSRQSDLERVKLLDLLLRQMSVSVDHHLGFVSLTAVAANTEPLSVLRDLLNGVEHHGALVAA